MSSIASYIDGDFHMEHNEHYLAYVMQNQYSENSEKLV